MTLACVLRSGGVYGPEWVARLARQAPKGWRFVCLTDMEVECESIPLIHEWPGWWAKMELFRPGLFSGLVLYLDLDTLVVGALDWAEGYAERFAALSDFYSPGLAASGVMLWRADEVNLYERMTTHPPERWKGRSDHWWNAHESPDRLQDLYPGEIGSYKVDELEEGPRDFSVVCFHGQPKQDVLGGWVEAHWTSEADMVQI